jgi:hypothetical protein
MTVAVAIYLVVVHRQRKKLSGHLPTTTTYVIASVASYFIDAQIVVEQGTKAGNLMQTLSFLPLITVVIAGTLSIARSAGSRAIAMVGLAVAILIQVNVALVAFFAGFRLL